MRVVTVVQNWLLLLLRHQFVSVSTTLLLAAATATSAPASGQASEPTYEDVPLDVVAASVRDRGYTCENPVEAKRDKAASKPDEVAWLIDCGNEHYRVIYKGDMGIEVETVKASS